jgi:hypothetical protein
MDELSGLKKKKKMVLAAKLLSVPQLLPSLTMGIIGLEKKRRIQVSSELGS